jgi:hypothetical protein
LNLHYVYYLSANGTAPNGLKDVDGDMLDGQGNGNPGSDYLTAITWSNLNNPRVIAD